MRNFATLTVALIASDITFITVDGNPNVPTIDGHAIVYSGSQSPNKGKLVVMTTNDERAREKVASRLRGGRMAPLAALTKAGNPRRSWNLTDAVVDVEAVEAAHAAAIGNRDEARKAATARRAEEKAAKAAAKAAEAAAAPAPAAGKNTGRKGRKAAPATVTAAPAARTELPQVARDGLLAAIAAWEAGVAESSASGDFDNVLVLTAKISEAQSRLAA